MRILFLTQFNLTICNSIINMTLYDSFMKKYLYTSVGILGFLRPTMIKETGIEWSDFLQHVPLQ